MTRGATLWSLFYRTANIRSAARLDNQSSCEILSVRSLLISTTTEQECPNELAQLLKYHDQCRQNEWYDDKQNTNLYRSPKDSCVGILSRHNYLLRRASDHIKCTMSKNIALNENLDLSLPLERWSKRLKDSKSYAASVFIFLPHVIFLCC